MESAIVSLEVAVSSFVPQRNWVPYQAYIEKQYFFRLKIYKCD